MTIFKKIDFSIIMKKASEYLEQNINIVDMLNNKNFIMTS